MSIIKTTLEDHIAIVTINRPEAYNAMNPNVIESLENQIIDFINDDNVGVIILTGERDQHFVVRRRFAQGEINLRARSVRRLQMREGSAF